MLRPRQHSQPGRRTALLAEFLERPRDRKAGDPQYLRPEVIGLALGRANWSAGYKVEAGWGALLSASPAISQSLQVAIIKWLKHCHVRINRPSECEE